MIKDIFILKKKSFWTWMMKWIWNLNYNDFTHMCPFFWLSIFNLLIITPFSIVKGIKKGILAVGDVIENYFDKQDRKECEKIQILINDEVYMKNYTQKMAKWLATGKKSCISRFDMKMYKYLPNRYYDKVYDIKFEIIDRGAEEALKTRILNKEKEDREYQQMLARKAKINKILKIVKPIGKIFLYLLALTTILLAAYGIYKLGVYTTRFTINWFKVKKAFKWIGIILGIVIGTILIALFISYLLKDYRMSCKAKKRWEMIGNTLLVLIVPFVWIGKIIYNSAEFLIAMIKQNCPAIKFKD